MKTLEIGKEMVIYQDGKAGIQDMMIEGADGVLRTQCRGLTFDEYVQDKAGLEGYGFMVISLDEACERINKIEDARYIKPFQEINEEIYTEMLECLPPQKWETVNGVNIFRMSEYTTGNITGHYVSYEGKYYMASRRTRTAYAEIAKEIKAI